MAKMKITSKYSCLFNPNIRALRICEMLQKSCFSLAGVHFCVTLLCYTSVLHFYITLLWSTCGGCKIQEMGFPTLILTLTPPPLKNFLALELNGALHCKLQCCAIMFSADVQKVWCQVGWRHMAYDKQSDRIHRNHPKQSNPENRCFRYIRPHKSPKRAQKNDHSIAICPIV